jgi:catechol 2,3-dioxygenase
VLGLLETGRDAQGHVCLKAWGEHDHHSVILREADLAGMDSLAWKVDSPATLAKLAADIKASGLATDMRWIEAGENMETGQRA